MSNTQVARTSTGIKEALQDHHRAVKDPNSGKIIHVYAYAGRAAFGENVDRLTFEVEVPYADLNWNLKGTFDTASYFLIAKLDVKFPLIGPIVSPDIAGSLRTTKLGVTYEVSDEIYGSATFSVIDGWLHAEFAATTYGATYDPFSIDLVQVELTT